MLFCIVPKSSPLWSLTACLIKCQSQVNPILFCCPAAVGFLNGRKMVEWMQVRLLGAWTEKKNARWCVLKMNEIGFWFFG
jgi:hypothetical protein